MKKNEPLAAMLCNNLEIDPKTRDFILCLEKRKKIKVILFNNMIQQLKVNRNVIKKKKRVYVYCLRKKKKIRNSSKLNMMHERKYSNTNYFANTCGR